MSPKKVYDLPPNLTFDKSSGRYRYRSPLNGKRTTLSHDHDEAIDKAKRLNIALELHHQSRIHGTADPDFGAVIASYITEKLPFEPFGEAHRTNILSMLKRIQAELGHQSLSDVDRLVIHRWIIARDVKPHQMRRYRTLFIRLYDYAIAQKWCDFNEAEATAEFSSSKKLSENKTLRKRMSLDMFWQIHDAAPLYMQVAMQMSLVTLQARQEVLNMQYSDIRDGHLFVIRKKTAGESDASFIKITVSDEIDRIVKLSRSSGIVSPCIVHRLPRSRQKSAKKKPPHPTYIRPQQLTLNFAYLRDKLGITDQYAADEAPTFHEIRSLGARMMEQQGTSKEHIKTLMAHDSIKTSDIYLDGRDTITDDMYKQAESTLILQR